ISHGVAKNVPRPAPMASIGASNGFRQAMLKTALETVPQLNKENYSIWKDKMTALLKLRGVLMSLNNTQIPLGESDNAELMMLLLSKMDKSAQKILSSIKERFASSQLSNCDRMFNDFLYVKFQEDAVKAFFTNIKVSIKKLVDVGIELPQDILAYLVLFKFPNLLQSLKRQIMHSDKDLTVEFETSSNRENLQNLLETNVRTDQTRLLNPQDAKLDSTIPNKTRTTPAIIAGTFIWKSLRIGGESHKNMGPLPTSLMINNFSKNLNAGRGTVRLTWGKASIALLNCLYVPDINSNFTVSKNGKLVLKGLIKNGLYSVNNPSSIGLKNNDPLVNIALPKELLQETHKKYGHACLQRIELFIDISISKSDRDQFEWKACILATITKQSFNNESKLGPFERLHLDLIGPIKPESSLKHRFILTIIDNHMRCLD
ncbi:hypothetical protein VP01_1193g1, partial [Puccinia sorghi]